MPFSDTASSDLSLLARAPSKDSVLQFFTALFQHRHALSSAPASAAAASLLALPAEEASRVALASGELLRRLLYESSELQSADAVRALLPRGLDPRLEALLGSVLFAGLPAWRDAAIEQRVSLPRLEGVAWRVDAAHSSSALSAANEPVLRLCLSVRDQPAWDGAMPATRDVAVALGPASLGALLEGMRRIKDQLAAFSS